MAIKKRVTKASVVSFHAQKYLNGLTRQFPNDADLGEYVREIFHDLSMNNSHEVSVPNISIKYNDNTFNMICYIAILHNSML